jgi:hypothetical protein
MKPKTAKNRLLQSAVSFKQVLTKFRFNNGTLKKPFKLSMKTNTVLAIFLIVIMLLSVFAWLSVGTQSKPTIIQPVNNDPTATPSPTDQQTTTASPTVNPAKTQDVTTIFRNIISAIPEVIAPRPPGLVESNPNMTNTVWKAVAANAWNYFQPGVGVDANTGLPQGSLDFPYFTDWDLGIYIQAIIDAQKIGLIGTDGAWNSSARLETVVTFLETRDLNSTTHYPYRFYQAHDGKDYHPISDSAINVVDGADAGRLFVALGNLKAFNSSLASRINNIVYNRSNYAAIVPSIKADSLTSTNIYAYYIASGFANFWPYDLSSAPATILNNMRTSGNVTTNGVSLPVASISGDPLFCSVFQLSNNPQLTALARQVYLAHEAYYNATGIYRAFSEGGTSSDVWAYEWVVLSDKRTWAILDETSANLTISPIIYTNIAMSFLSIYNTSFAYNMVVYLEKTLPDPTKGYCQGVDETGNQLTGVNVVTNGLILGSALYALQRNP